MKILLRVAVVVAGMLAVVAGARCAEFAGTWKGAFEMHGNNVPLTLYLSTENGAVTGTIEGLPTNPAEIHDGKIDGDTVTFSVNTDYQGQTYKVIFKGTKSSADGSIHFTMATEDGSWSSDLVAQKAVANAAEPAASTAPSGAGSSDAASSATASVVPAAASSADAAPAMAGGAGPASADTPDVTGTWKGSFDYQGTAVPVTFHFTEKSGVLTGTVNGMMEGAPDKPTDIHDGTIQGAAVNFSVNTLYQGETYRIVYKGKLDGGTKIDFTFGTEDGSWSSQMTATRATESAQQ